MGLSVLGAGNFILGGVIAFKIFYKPTYEWVVVTKTEVFQIVQIQCPYPNSGSSSCSLPKVHHHVVITLPTPNKKCPMNSSPRGLTAV